MKKILKSRLYLSIASVIGLWIPVPYLTGGVTKGNVLTNNCLKWEFTMQIGEVPLGWIMTIVAIIVKKL